MNLNLNLSLKLAPFFQAVNSCLQAVCTPLEIYIYHTHITVNWIFILSTIFYPGNYAFDIMVWFVGKTNFQMLNKTGVLISFREIMLWYIITYFLPRKIFWLVEQNRFFDCIWLIWKNILVEWTKFLFVWTNLFDWENQSFWLNSFFKFAK